MDEREAVRQLQRGEMAGLAWLVGVYQVEALRVAVLITRDRALAEDVVQATFLRLYEHIDHFDAGRPFRPYLLRSVMNDATKAAARRGRAVSWQPRDDEWRPDPEPGPEAAVIAAEDAAAVRAALTLLTPDQRQLLVRRYYLGWTDGEMAAAEARPPGTIKSRLHAARRQLRRLLGEFEPGEQPPR